MQDVQKLTGSVSEASRESQATGCFWRLAHAESRVVFPLPAEAETRVKGEVWTASSSASRRERSTRKLGRRGGESLVESNAEDGWEEEARACAWRSNSCARILAVSSKRASETMDEGPR